MTPDRVERDSAAYVDFLAWRESVRAGRLGWWVTASAVHLQRERRRCVRTKSRRQRRFMEVVFIQTATASPHHVLPRIKARLYFGHAVNDQSMPAEAIEKLGRALASWGDE